MTRCNCHGPMKRNHLYSNNDPDDANWLPFCDCRPDFLEWETLQPQLKRLVFELSIEFMPASKLGKRLVDEYRRQVPDEHVGLIERGVEILEQHNDIYSKVEVWEIDSEHEEVGGHVFMLYPRSGDEPVMIDMQITLAIA